MYNLAGFASGTTNGQDPWLSGSAAPMAEGASLVVVYVQEGGVLTTIQLYRGFTTFIGGTASQTIALPTPTTGSSQTTFIAADGQSGAWPKTVTANGVPLPSVTLTGTDPQAGPPFVFGDLSDTQSADTSAALPKGSASETLAANFTDDCVVWDGQVISYH